MPASRIALVGPPGSGKSTTRDILRDYAQQEGYLFFHLRLAEPLYAAQAHIYNLAGKPLDDPYRQDGIVLSFLGAEMRRINPDLMKNSAITQLHSFADRQPEEQPTLIVCDDARPADLSFLSTLGFSIVSVTASDELTRQRRHLRGDISILQGEDPNDTDTSFKTDLKELAWNNSETPLIVRNTGTMQELRQQIRNLWRIVAQ